MQPESKEYNWYMDKMEKQCAQDKAERENTSVVEGNKLAKPPQFSSKGYSRYMKAHLKGGMPAVQPAEVDESEDLGESVSGPESVPGQSYIETSDRPPVREIARGRPTAQSSIEFGAAAARAVDGRTDGTFSHGSCTHTKQDTNPWWRVDLGKTMNIQHIEVYNRADCCGERLERFQVRVGDSKTWEKNMKCGKTNWSVKQGKMVKIPCNTLQGQYVFVVIPATMPLNLCEVKVFGSDNPGANAARGMPTEQSSTMKGGSSDRAVDGHTNTDFKDNSCTHTEYELKPWWKVDLGKKRTVSAVQVWNRGDCCGSRLDNFEVRVGMNGGMWTAGQRCGQRWKVPQGQHKEISCGKKQGRYVWVVLQNRNVLTLCEVRVLTTFAKKGINIARNKPTEQSSTGYGGYSKRAVDGNTDTNYKAGSCTHTHFDQEPWWKVDLEKSQAVGAVQIWNRGDCCGARLSNFEVRVGDGVKWQGTKVCGNERQKIAQGMRKTILCGGASGRYVYIVKRDQGYMNLCEVRVLPYKGAMDDYSKSDCVAKAIGMESRKIKNGDVSASSFYGNIDEYGPNNARLNYRGSTWQPLHEKLGEWIQVLLPGPFTVTGVATQGSFEADKWVTSYKVRYFKNQKWNWLGGGNGQDFKANVDRNSAVTNDFKTPFKTTKVRIYPSNWKGAAAMRVEIFGRNCEIKKSTPAALAAVSDSAVQAKGCPKCKAEGRRRRSLELLAERGYGEGSARLWYAATKGGDRGINAHSVYVSKGTDFRTEDGSIFAAKDLVAGKALQIQAWPGFGYGQAELWFAKRGVKTYKSNTLYLRTGDFRTQEGSIYSSDSVRAGQYISLGAFPGFGDASSKANFWFAASAKSDSAFKSDTVYLQAGNLATQKGSIVSGQDVIASRFMTLKAFPNHGSGEASFMYSAAAKAPFKSNTVYLKVGNFGTQQGSIFSKNDIEVGQFLRIKSMNGYGEGESKLWYAKDTMNGFGPNTLYVNNGDLKTVEGSVVAAKDLIAGRSLKINAYPGLGSGTAELKFSKVATANTKANTLYLASGDFRTQYGSIVAAKDLGAGNSVKIKSMSGHGDGQAELFYSHSAKGNMAAKTLYLKEGDFQTQAGDIRAGHNLHASRYVEIKAFPGFGHGSTKMWHCNRDLEGYKANSLYLKNGDFRTEDGSIHANKDVVAGRYLKVEAKEGFGTGSTRLWYSAQGKDQYRGKTLYLDHGDFHTETGSIVSAKDMTAGRYLQIKAWPGHGEGFAKLWHSKMEARGFGADTLYLENGHFQVQKGSIKASGDIHVGRELKVGAKAGYGTGSAALWYSGAGKVGVEPHTLYLDSGDIRTQSGDVRSARDVHAKGKLIGKNLEVTSAFVKGTITAGHLFLGEEKPAAGAAGAGGRRLLGENKPVEVGAVLRDLAEGNDAMRAKNSALRDDLQKVMDRIASLEEVASRR